MILSASRRTDIPAYYSEWFFNRIKEGYALVRNPMNPQHVSKVAINPDVTDCIVFWTKNARPMLSRLNEINGFNYYFQFTINPYGKDIEESVPRKNSVIETFNRLSDMTGSNRVVWRYDPILITDSIDIDYHIRYFESIAKKIEGRTKRCMIGTLDNYIKVSNRLDAAGVRQPSPDETLSIAKHIAEIGRAYGIDMQMCTKPIDLSAFGITRGSCIDRLLIEEVTGYNINVKKDKNQRPECSCAESIDIGEYNTCIHNCIYCYANYAKERVLKKYKAHNPESPLLFGELGSDDIVTERPVMALRQKGLF